MRRAFSPVVSRPPSAVGKLIDLEPARINPGGLTAGAEVLERRWDQLSSAPIPHFDQSNCLEKSTGEPPSISMVELGFAPHKVEADLGA
jgi:hypothetical protein